ncbi:MAG: hypothetical protein ACOZAQ_06540 [Pseudomonadota bacterium]
MKNPQQTSILLRTLIFGFSAATALSLAACGGGGGGNSSETSQTSPNQTYLDSTQIQGRWVSPVGINPSKIANVVPVDANNADAWVLSLNGNSAVGLNKLRINRDYSISGKYYDLTQANAVAQSVSGAAVTNLGSTPKSLAFNGLASGAMTLNPSTSAADAGNQADAVGTWSTTAGSGTILISWTVATDGSLSGASSSGCLYSGKLVAQPSAQAFNAQVIESCQGISTALGGIATVSSDKQALKFLATTADESRSVVMLLAK